MTLNPAIVCSYSYRFTKFRRYRLFLLLSFYKVLTSRMGSLLNLITVFLSYLTWHQPSHTLCRDLNTFAPMVVLLIASRLRQRSQSLACCTIEVELRWTPHPIILPIRDNKDYIRVLLYSYYTTMGGVLLKSTIQLPNITKMVVLGSVHHSTSKKIVIIYVATIPKKKTCLRAWRAQGFRIRVGWELGTRFCAWVVGALQFRALG